ncbi:MAG: hypothetical protein OEM26_19470 [Saprospiraceae bacterium]|nr:hypothetical protein [Saprospiraceae bacterium]
MKNFKKQLNLSRFSFIPEIIIVVLVFKLGTGSLYGQDPLRFADQVAEIKDRQIDSKNPYLQAAQAYECGPILKIAFPNIIC